MTNESGADPVQLEKTRRSLFDLLGPRRGNNKSGERDTELWFHGRRLIVPATVDIA
jgi:hypothetical protein